MKKNIIIFSLLLVGFCQSTFAQKTLSESKDMARSPAVGASPNQGGSSTTVSEAEAAIRVGSAKELSRYFSESVEISFDGKKSNYSRTQGEYVMRDFFSKNEPQTTESYHKGSSGKKLNYAILKYTSKIGNYRIFIKIKQHQNRYLIDAIDLTKE